MDSDSEGELVIDDDPKEDRNDNKYVKTTKTVYDGVRISESENTLKRKPHVTNEDPTKKLKRLTDKVIFENCTYLKKHLTAIFNV